MEEMIRFLYKNALAARHDDALRVTEVHWRFSMEANVSGHINLF